MLFLQLDLSTVMHANALYRIVVYLHHFMDVCFNAIPCVKGTF